MHLTGDFDFVIEAGDRVCFGRALDGEQLITSVNDIKEYKPSVSTHGHLPWKGTSPPSSLPLQCCIRQDNPRREAH